MPHKANKLGGGRLGLRLQLGPSPWRERRMLGIGRLLMLALAVGGLMACGSNGDKEDLNAPAPLADFEAEERLRTVWRRDIGEGQGKKFNRLQPAIDGDYIYAVDTDGDVFALDRFTGKTIWKADVDRDVSGGVGVGDGLLLLGTPQGELIALNQDTGEELWQARLGGEVLSPAATDGDVVVVQTFDGKLFGLNAYSGEELWSFTSQVPVLTLRGTAGPVIEGGRAFAAFANGKVVAADIDSGFVAWEGRVALPQGESEIERVVDVDGTPLLLPTAICAASYQGRVVAFDPGTGRPMWYHESSSYVSMAEGFGNVYLSAADGAVVALDQRTGTERWTNDALSNRRLSAPTTFGSYVAVADFQGYVHVLSQVDGSFVARKKLGSKGVRAPILSSDDTIYVYGNKGALAAYEIRD